MVYEDIYDAKNAVDHLSGFNVANRYLIVLYYNPAKTAKKRDAAKEEASSRRFRPSTAWMVNPTGFERSVDEWGTGVGQTGGYDRGAPRRCNQMTNR